MRSGRRDERRGVSRRDGAECSGLPAGPYPRRHLECDIPVRHERTIEIGMAHVRAHRISYVGELGTNLHPPSSPSMSFSSVGGGRPQGLRSAGLLAMDALRLEKAYRHFGHDISEEDHVLEAGLGFAVKTQKRRGRFGDFSVARPCCASATPASRAASCNSSSSIPRSFSSTTRPYSEMAASLAIYRRVAMATPLE